VSRGLYERLCDIKERCEQLVEDLHGDRGSVSNDRILAKAVLYDLHVIGEACGALPDELRLRHTEVNWKGWADFRNLTTHQYWRADATIAAEAMERAIPMLVALVATELPGAAEAAGVDPSAPELTWSLAGAGDQPATDDAAAEWWNKQRRGSSGEFHGKP
jgi:uncharacterized protein with HEPN domain